MNPSSPVNIIKHENCIEIRPEPDCLEEIADCRDMVEVLEHWLCNGWEVIRPEECGALTCALIITDDWSRDDETNEITYLGRVYWEKGYEITDFREVLARGESVYFPACD